MNRIKSNTAVLINLALLTGFFFSCHTSVKNAGRGLMAHKAMVVSAHPEASAIGMKIIQEGGNAVDAAVAVEYALAVCFPAAGNIGGGGFMVMRFNDGSVNTIDYREKAPLLASRNMYLDNNGNIVPQLSTRHILASGVPGTVAGTLEAHAKYGKLPFAQVIQPAIDLARNGFPLTLNQANSLNSIREGLLEMNTDSLAFLKDGGWLPGDTLRQEDLAHTLEQIRDHGRDGFYSGPVADRILQEMEKRAGLIRQQDLDQYKPVWRAPVRGSYKSYTIISMAPPSSGGICLLQMLSMLEDYPLDEYGWNTLQTIHVMTEAERRVYADRAQYLGDPDFVTIPVTGLLSREYNRQRMKDFSPRQASLSAEISHGNPLPYESEETTHYSVIDAWGNAVAGTTTLNGGYGSMIVAHGAGFLLNNQMDDFSARPGFPNMYGLVGGDANAIEPGKRMLSSMTPTIVEKEGKLFMVVGSPGGSTIITSVLQTILNVIEHGMTMQDAVSAGRFHHQWLPDMIVYEESAIDSITLHELVNMGYTLQPRSSIGRVDAILVLPDGSLEGGADPRGDDTAKGWNR
jgi:gamma-glutamyltranspeptidase/glutathione hydrolase